MQLQMSSKKVVLIVDDEALVRDSIEHILEAYDYSTLTAKDGVEAIALYAKHQTEISIVLIDLMMTSLDGATTIRVLRAINSHVKIVAMSGLSFYDVGHFLDKTVVDGFLVKPFTIQEMFQAFQAIDLLQIR